jgi:hypothetical protein
MILGLVSLVAVVLRPTPRLISAMVSVVVPEIGALSTTHGGDMSATCAEMEAPAWERVEAVSGREEAEETGAVESPPELPEGLGRGGAGK